MQRRTINIALSVVACAAIAGGIAGTRYSGSNRMFGADGPVVPSPPGAPVRDEKTPIIKLTGPGNAHVGDQLTFTSDGSNAQDIQFTISPPTQFFVPVKLLDGKDTPGVIHTPVAPGIYYIQAVGNGNNRTALFIHIIQVEARDNSVPVVPITPNKIYIPALKAALETDAKTDTMFAQSVAQLESLFGQWGAIADASKDWTQFGKTFKDASATVIGDKLPASRKVISEYINSRLPRDADSKYDPQLIKTVLSEILQSIKLSKN